MCYQNSLHLKSTGSKTQKSILSKLGDKTTWCIFGDKRIAFMMFFALDTRTFFLWRQAHCVYGVSCSGYTYFLALETSTLRLWCFLLWIHVLSCFGDKHIAFMVFLAMNTRTFLFWKQAHCDNSVSCSGYTYFLALETSA